MRQTEGRHVVIAGEALPGSGRLSRSGGNSIARIESQSSIPTVSSCSRRP